MRRWLWTGIVLVVAAALLAPGTPAGAVPPPPASGDLRCEVATGLARMKRPLLDGAAGTSTWDLVITLQNCRGVVGISGGKLRGSFLAPTDCSRYDGGGSAVGPGAFTVKWKGSSRFAPTTVPALSGFASAGQPRFLASFSNVNVKSAGTVTGSFAGGNVGFWLSGDKTSGQWAAACAPKVPGVQGGGGLHRLDLFGSPGGTPLGVYASS